MIILDILEMNIIDVSSLRMSTNTSQHDSTGINTSPTRVNTSQLDQEVMLVYRSLACKV